MERKLVSKNKLLSILNRELSKYDVCENFRFEGILELAEEDEDGFNWSGANVRVGCSGIASEMCNPLASRIVLEVGKKYNIKKHSDRRGMEVKTIKIYCNDLEKKISEDGCYDAKGSSICRACLEKPVRKKVNRINNKKLL